LENVCDNVEEEGGEGINLPQAATTLDPPTRDTIEEDNSLARVIE
jgi:hypothetical protein